MPRGRRAAAAAIVTATTAAATTAATTIRRGEVQRDALQAGLLVRGEDFLLATPRLLAVPGHEGSGSSRSLVAIERAGLAQPQVGREVQPTKDVLEYAGSGRWHEVVEQRAACRRALGRCAVFVIYIPLCALGLKVRVVSGQLTAFVCVCLLTAARDSR